MAHVPAGPPEWVFREIAYCTFCNKEIIKIGTRVRVAETHARGGRARVINLFCRHQKYIIAVDRSSYGRTYSCVHTATAVCTVVHTVGQMFECVHTRYKLFPIRIQQNFPLINLSSIFLGNKTHG